MIPGKVSRVTGRRQRVALRAITLAAALLSLMSLLIPGRVGEASGATVVTLVVLTPLARLGWLMWRWWQERDLRFVLLGATLYAVIGLGALLASLT